MISRDPSKIWYRHRRRERLKNALAFGLLFFAIATYVAWDRFGNTILSSGFTSSLPTVFRPSPSLPTVYRPSPSSRTVSRNQVQVVDGDTVRVAGRTYRLVGFDTPERGSGARCEREHALAEQATAYLQRIIDGGVRLDPVRCSCRPGTEGTSACNYGRLCAVLTASGRDVGSMMIQAGLARSYRCHQTGCPRRQPWC
jgi:endonuclease YncB( thermonuclease family)